MIGKRIEQYVIESQLGAGGMGVVYRAFDTRLERPVAIKVFADLAATPKALNRLLHEARSASALNHPHICTIHEVGESGDLPFLVMEFIEGQPLSQLIPDGGLSSDAVMRYGAQVASALAHAHARGVVHRDLKCLNVIVTSDGHAKVLDFGIALREIRVNPDAETVVDTGRTLQSAGSMAGTVAYMAPEALRGQPVDHRVDIWALGVVLYEMASARLPFSGRTTFELCGQILHQAPPPLADRVPQGLRAIVLRCLAKDPGLRYQDAAEVRAALEAMGAMISTSSSVSVSLPIEERRALLVLPFTNVTTDAESDYFADGLTEEIIADLSNVRQLRVISRTSSMQFKGTSRTVAELASQLRVSHVLEGGVRRAGAALRVTATLVDASTDSPVWSEKYSGTLDDVFAIQERLSRAIVGALKLVLTAEEDEKLKVHPIPDARAYEWYLRAKQEMLRFTKDGLDRAIECLEKSQAIVGENAVVLAATGEACWQYVNAGISADPAYLDKAEACARRAVELDPALPHGHRVSGLVRVHRGDLVGAFRELRRALEIDPNDPDSLLWGCLMASMLGQMTVATAWAARLVEIDPVTPFYQLMPGSMAWMSGDFARAASMFSDRYADVSGIPVMRFVYAHALVAADRGDEGHRELEATAIAMPDNPFGQLSTVFHHALLGQRDDVGAGLTPSLVAGLEGDPQYCWFLAECHALVGDVDEGVKWLQTSVSRGFLNHAMMAQHDPFLANLRSDSRFVALMADVERRMRSLDV